MKRIIILLSLVYLSLALIGNAQQAKKVPTETAVSPSISGTVKFATGETRRFSSVAGVVRSQTNLISGGYLETFQRVEGELVFYGKTSSDSENLTIMIPISKILTVKVVKQEYYPNIEIQSIKGTKETISPGMAFLLDIAWADGVLIRRYNYSDLYGVEITFDHSPKKNN